MFKTIGTILLAILGIAFVGGAFGFIALWLSGDLDKAKQEGIIDTDGSITELLKGRRRR